MKIDVGVSVKTKVAEKTQLALLDSFAPANVYHMADINPQFTYTSLNLLTPEIPIMVSTTSNLTNSYGREAAYDKSLTIINSSTASSGGEKLDLGLLLLSNEDGLVNENGFQFFSINPYFSSGSLSSGFGTEDFGKLNRYTPLENWFYRLAREDVIQFNSRDFSLLEQANDSENTMQFDLFEAGLPTGNNSSLPAEISGSVAALFSQSGNIGFAEDSGTLPYTSAGISLTYQVVNATLTASAGATVIFVINLSSNGDFIFTLENALDHLAANNEDAFLQLAIGNLIVLIDEDGQPHSLDANALIISINDDWPVINFSAPTAAVVHEDALVNANVDTPNPVFHAQGSLNATINFGGDGIGQFNYLNPAELQMAWGSLGLTVGGNSLSYTVINDTLTAFDASNNIVFILVVQANGGYQFDLLHALDHDQLTSDSNLAINFGALIVASDRDGDEVSLNGYFTLHIQDDAALVQTSGVPLASLQVSEAALNTPATISIVDAFSVSPGADGIRDVSFALHIINANSGLIDSLNGEAVFLIQVSPSLIEGYADGEVVFSLSIDNNGDLTFTQYRAIIHADGLAMNSINLAANIITMSMTVHDGDGDAATAFADAGVLINIVDSVPNLVVNAANADTIVVDEALMQTATASVAGAFIADFGADGGIISYTLAINGGDGTPSGLVDSLSGEAVLLQMNGNTIEGIANGQLVFTVSIDNDGNVSFTQYRAVMHAAGNGANTIQLDANILHVIATASDSDNDLSTSQLDLGVLITIVDDVPSIMMDASNMPVFVADEATMQPVSASIAAAFIANFGADNGALSYSLVINGGDGTASGFVDSLSGEPVLLQNNAGVIEGLANGQLVFTVSIDNAGVVTFSQYRAVVHPDGGGSNDAQFAANVLQAIASATDSDSDVFDAVMDLGAFIHITDDVPSINFNAANANTFTADEALMQTVTGSVAAAFTPDFGADGGILSYALAINGGDGSASGLVDSLSGEAVLLQMNGITVEGIANGQLVFSVSIDNLGNASFTQYRAVIHPDGNGTNAITLAANVLQVIATALDADNDAVNAVLDLGNLISIIDDVPSFNVNAANAGDLTADEALMQTITASLAPAFAADVGADGGILSYALAINGGDGTPSGLVDSLSGEAVLLQMNGTTVEGIANGQLVFSVSIDNLGNASFTQFRAVIHPDGGGTNPISLSANVLQALANIVDGDNDIANAALDLGSLISIVDDIPSINVNAANADSFTADEALMQTVTGSVAAAFTPDFGADGGNLSYALAINGGNGTASGLIDSVSGEAVLLQANGNIIEGIANGQLVFTVGIDNLGNVSFTQYRATLHADGGGTNSIQMASNVLQVIAIALDADNDFANQVLDLGALITINDATPQALNNAPLSILAFEDGIALGNSEGLQPTIINGSLAGFVNYGNDGLGLFAFDNDYIATLTSLNLTHHGQPLTYAVNGDLLTARVGVVDVFTLELNVGGVAGAFRFTLLSSLDHALGNGDDSEVLSFNVGAVINAADADLDWVNLDGKLLITIQDDVPLLTANVETIAIYENTISDDPAIVSGNLADVVSFGGDGIGFFQLLTSLNNLPLVTVNGIPVTYQVNGNVLSAMIASEVIFSLEIEATGEYTFTLFHSLDHANALPWLSLDFSNAVRAVDGDGDVVDLTIGHLIVNVANGDGFNPEAGDALYLTTTMGGVVDMQGHYGLSLLDPIEGDLPGLIASLIGPGGLLAGGTTEDALDLILAQQGVFFSDDVLKLSSDGYEMAFNGSENLYQTDLLSQLGLLGLTIDSLHVAGNQILFSIAGDGFLPGVGSFENQDLILATQNANGLYQFQRFFDGSALGLQDALLNDGVFNNLAVDFNLDDASFTSSDGTFNNGRLYFTLSNLVDVDLAYALLSLDVLGGLTASGSDVLSIDRVNGVWDTASLEVFFRSEDIGLSDELLGNALQALNNVNLAGLITALLDPDTRVIDIDGLHVDGDTLYFSLQPLVDVDLLFGTLGEVLSNPFDPLSALTFRGEDIFSISKNPLTGLWDVNTLSLYFDGSQYNLAANDGLLGGLLDNLPENLNAFSISDGTEKHPVVMFSTSGGGDETQVGAYDNQTLVENYNGRFIESFNLAEVTNNAVTNRNINSVHVLENGNLLFSLSVATVLPGGLNVAVNDVVQWNGSSFSLYFDGSNHNLANDMQISSLYIYPTGHPLAGQMVFSVQNDGSLPGVGAFENHDLLLFNPATNTYSMLFNGEDAGIEDLKIQVEVQASLAAGVAPAVNALFLPLNNALDARIEALLGNIEQHLQNLDVMLGNLNGGLLGSLLNVVNGLLTTLDNLLGTNLDGLVDNLATVTGVNNLIGQLDDLIDELTPLPLSLILQAGLVNSIKAEANTLITQLNNLAVNEVNDLNNALDSVDNGIGAIISTLQNAVSAGADLEFKLIDVSIDGLHILQNGDYVLSFAQELRLDLDLQVDTAFLNGLAALNLGVNTQNIISGLDTILDPIIAPLLGSIHLADVLSPDLDLMGMNAYRLHHNTVNDTWQFSLYFDGRDHGLDNGLAADKVLDYVNSISNNMTLLNIQDQGLLKLSTNENIDALYIIEPTNNINISGSHAADLVVGNNNNNMINGGLGNDVLIGGKGADTFTIDDGSTIPAAPQQDIVADYNHEEGDVIFLDDIFNNFDNNLDSLSDYIDLSVINQDGVGGANDTLLNLSADPDGPVVHSIVLLNYTPQGATPQEMLTNLINNGGISAG